MWIDWPPRRALVNAAGVVMAVAAVSLAAVTVAGEPDAWLADCQPPGTLLQWSCGNSFGGGPPGRDEPLASDRPDFTEASTTVGRGVVQLEMGYTYIADDEGPRHAHAHSYPELLARIGILAEWLELRIAFNHATQTEDLGPLPANTSSGSEDLYLGFKLALTPQEGILPEMALMPQWTVPTGHNAFSADEVLPGLNWLYGWDISDRFSTAGSTQINKGIDDLGDVYLEIAQSWTVGISFTDHFGAYTEWFVIGQSGSDAARTQHYLNGGLVFPVTHDLQFDLRAGVGLSDASDDFFAGAGLVVRL